MAHPLYLDFGLVIVLRVGLQNVLDDGGIDGDDGLFDAAEIEAEGVAEVAAVYFDSTCTGLPAMARESAKERKRETAGIGGGKVCLAVLIVRRVSRTLRNWAEAAGIGSRKLRRLEPVSLPSCFKRIRWCQIALVMVGCWR